MSAAAGGDPASTLRQAGQGEPGESWEERRVRALRLIAEDPPFEPVGTANGICWVISHSRELRGLGPKDLSRNGISMLCGNQQQWLIDNYPRRKKARNVPADSFAPEQVADAIIASCRVMGVWSPEGRVRGRGAWVGEDGELVLHLGDTLWINGRTVPCGRRGEYVYPVAPRIPRPSREAQPAGPQGPAALVLRRLESFHFRRAALDRRLLLGWMCAALLGGALDVRPHAFLTGERGTGKSTLQLLMRCVLLDGDAVVAVSDATAAGLWQALGFDALPAMVDELESEADNARADAIIKLARQASTGGLVLRGGADHKGAQFTARSAFLFAAVTMPALRAQDRSRIVQLDLLPLEGMTPFSVSSLFDAGRGLLRRLVDGWERLNKHALPAYRDELMARGWDARGASVYGTLLACADVALNDVVARDELADLVEQLEEARALHRADEAPSWRRCLDHLLACMVDPLRRGERRPLGSLVLQAAGYGDATIPKDEHGAIEGGVADPSMRGEARAREVSQLPDGLIAHDQLRALGVRIEYHQAIEGRPPERVLAVANSHPALSEVFRHTDWSSEPGRPGAWRQALARCPNSAQSANTTRFRGVATRSVLVPLEAAIAGLVGVEQPSPDVIDATRALYRPDEAPTRMREPGEGE